MLKELGLLLQTDGGRLSDLGYQALLGDGTISVMKGSAKIGVWQESKSHLVFETAAGIRQEKLQADTAQNAADQTFAFLTTLNR